MTDTVEPGAAVAAGDAIPAWTLDAVDGQRMRTMTAILRDPYPIHYDPEAGAELGFGHRLVNQAPLSLGYIANMLMEWQGPDSVRRLTARFRAPVLDGDRVVAGGTVTEVVEVDGERRAVCDVWLDGDQGRVVAGTAVVALTAPDRPGRP